MILVIDNYDSFTFNLVQALEAAGADVRVVRNDAIDIGAVAAMADDPAADLRGIVISPGPGDPDDAGISVGAVHVVLPLVRMLGFDAASPVWTPLPKRRSLVISAVRVLGWAAP